MDYIRLRSLLERLVALVIIILSAPLLLFAGLLIRLESQGSMIYSQERVGRNRRRKDRRQTSVRNRNDHRDAADRRKGDRRKDNIGGEPFTIYKLRSMISDAEKQTGAAWSTGDLDPRVTKVGHFIRKTHIDEIPQFFNVFLGQMSIIGPRPERPIFIGQLSKEIEDYRIRLNVPPGITGLAQVRQDADGSLEDVKQKLQYDKEYIDNTRLSLDIKIILQTFALICGLFMSALNGGETEIAEPTTADTLIHEGIRAERN